MRVVASVVAALTVAALIGIALLSQEGKGDLSTGLRVERGPGATGSTDLWLYVEDQLNVPETTGGSDVVELECVDSSGKVIVEGSQPWPLTETDGGTLDAHAHQTLTPMEDREVTRCRLVGTGLEAKVTDAGVR